MYALRQAEGGKKVSEDLWRAGCVAGGALQLEAALRRARVERASPAARRKPVCAIHQAHQLSERRAYGLIGITRWSYRYQSRRDPKTNCACGCGSWLECEHAMDTGG